MQSWATCISETVKALLTWAREDILVLALYMVITSILTGYLATCDTGLAWRVFIVMTAVACAYLIVVGLYRLNKHRVVLADEEEPS